MRAVVRARGRRCLLAGAVLALLGAKPALAQGLAPAADVDPPAYPFRLGPLLFAPGVRLDQFGVDTNIFIQAEEPKEDFVVTVTPEVNLFLRPRAMRVIGNFGAGFNYFQRYTNERYVAPAARVRAELLLGRLRPYAAVGRVDTRDRTNREIDARARHADTEAGGGVAYAISPASFVYASVTSVRTAYRTGERFGGVDLQRALDRRMTSYDAGVRLSLTPLTTLSLVGGAAVDDFVFDPSRDAISRYVLAEFVFSADAIFRGTARVGYRGFRPDSTSLDAFHGLTTQVRLVYPVLDRGSVAVGVQRDLAYSFERDEGYYVETTGDFSYTHRVAGGWDVQGRLAATRMNYGDEVVASGRVDGVKTAGAGVGYNFADQSRLGLNYEWWRRSSDRRADRRYDRTRFYASWAYTF